MPKDWKVTEAEDDEGDDADQEDFETLEMAVQQRFSQFASPGK